MRIRTKLSILISPALIVAGFCVAARFACGCADIADVPSAVDELPPDVLASARGARPGLVFTGAVKHVENKAQVLRYRLEGRDASGARFMVLVFADRRTQVIELPETPRLEPIDPPASPAL